MLVCNVSLRPPRAGIAADITEAIEATDATASGNIVFATLVDDPASVGDLIDAYLGEIMLEAASAADAVTAGSAFAGAVVEAVTAADTQDAVAALSYATFDGIPNAAVVMSNGNLTVTRTTGANGPGVQSTTTKTSGKHYFEVQMQVSLATGNGVGIMPLIGGAFVEYSGSYPNGVGVFLGNTSNVMANGVNTGKNAGTHAVGARVCAAIDMTARLAWFRINAGNWNGDGAANPTTGTGGVSFPSGALAPMVRFESGLSTDAFTANFGASAFTYSVPSGFTSGWPS